MSAARWPLFAAGFVLLAASALALPNFLGEDRQPAEGAAEHPADISPAPTTGLGPTETAVDTRAQHQILNAATAMETLWVDTGDFGTATPEALHIIDPDTTYLEITPPADWRDVRVDASAERAEVAFSGEGSSYLLASLSGTGRLFVMRVEKPDRTERLRREPDGRSVDGW